MRPRPFVGNDRGSTIVEFALSSFVFLMTIFGILGFGQAVWRYNMVSNLAKEGARRAVVCGSTTGLSTSECNIGNYVRSRAAGYLTICSTCVTTTPSTISTLTAGSTVAVRVTHAYTPLTPLIRIRALTFSSTAQMIVSR
jgi:Flp pilus assembly protein TadG